MQMESLRRFEMRKLAKLALFLGSVCLALSAAGVVGGGGSLDSAFQAMKDAVAQKDAGQVKMLAAQTCAMAREVIESPAPQADEEKEAWTKRVEAARDVELYTEYALYATAIQAQPADTVDLLAALVQQNPKSKYLAEGYSAYFYALHKLGATAKIPAVAEQALANFPNDGDALMILAEDTYAHKQLDRALGYAKRLTASGKGKPAELASGYWIAGVVEAEKGHYFEADKSLRTALPLVAGSDIRKAYALFYLGMANYQLGKMQLKKGLVLEAAQFSKEAAAIHSPVAQQAWHNAMVMKDEAAKMR
jgi:hypothetical protein